MNYRDFNEGVAKKMKMKIIINGIMSLSNTVLTCAANPRISSNLISVNLCSHTRPVALESCLRTLFYSIATYLATTEIWCHDVITPPSSKMSGAGVGN